MIDWLRRVRRQSIWAPGAIPASEGLASRELKRVILPLFDGILILMGAISVKLGMPSFDIVFNDFISSMSSWALLAAALTAFAGLALPHLWYLEAAGKVIMFVILGGYSAALWVLFAQGVGDRGPVACAFTALLLLPGWNLWRIGRERRAREALGDTRKAF